MFDREPSWAFSPALAYVILVRRLVGETLLLLSALPIALVANSTSIVVTAVLPVGLGRCVPQVHTRYFRLGDDSYARCCLPSCSGTWTNFTRETESIKPGEVCV